MGRTEIKVEETIHASHDEVFKVIADPERLTKWLPGVSHAKHVGDKKHVGAERHLTIKLYGVAVRSHQVVTEYEPGKRFAWVHTKDTVDGEPFDMLQDIGTIFELRGRGKSTHVTATAHFTPNGFRAALAVPVLSFDIRKQMEGALQNLKGLCE